MLLPERPNVRKRHKNGVESFEVRVQERSLQAAEMPKLSHDAEQILYLDNPAGCCSLKAALLESGRHDRGPA